MCSEFEKISFKNNGKLKLLIIVGTRPEIIRLSAIITKCRQYFDTVLAHTGQNYDYTLNGVFFKDLKLQDIESDEADLVGSDEEECKCPICQSDLKEIMYEWNIGLNEYTSMVGQP